MSEERDKYLQEIQANISQKGSELASWRALIESPGWLQYKKFMELQRTTRLFVVAETPLNNFGETLKQEFMKGEGAGIGLSLMFPYTQVELLALDVERLSTQLELEKDNVQKSGEIANAGSRVDSSEFTGE